MMRKLSSTLLGIAAATLLAACGGGGGNSDKPVTAADPLEVPASAGQSNAGLVGYLGGLPAEAADNREPVSVDGFVPPTSDTDEPIPVDG
jgi:ABC-type glycerol-3-phosphate transport system substrate-binding protein